MPRPVKPWIGASDSAMPPPRVRLRIFLAFGGKCQLTGREIKPGDKWALDHRAALCNGGKNEEANLWPVLEEAHKIKTRDDVAEKAEVASRAKAHLGIKGRPTALAGPDRVTLDARKAEHSKARQGEGKLPMPPRRVLPGFVSAGDA